MRIKSNLILLIFCVAWSLGIAEFLDENNDASSSLHIRKKRVIDKTANGGLPVQLSRARYIVNILRNGVSCCAGTILDADIIITATYCFREKRGVYTILSNTSLRNNGNPHHVARRTFTELLGFVVVKITPPIELQHGLNARIDFFLGVIPPHASGFFSGWGCNNQESEHGHSFPEQLMQTKLPILTHQECSDLYAGHFADERICTLDRSRRRSPCLGDEGGPLVYHDRLLGILLYRGRPAWEYPDIFLNFNNPNTRHLVNFHVNVLRAVH